MNDKISQEEIDKLLKDAVSSPALSSSDGAYQYLTVEEVDTLGEISNIFMGSASTTLSMLLGCKVEITTPQVQEFTSVEESFVVKEDHAVTEIEYIEGLKGTTVFALKLKDTAIIANLMMGGDGNVENVEVGEMELSAVSEAMNQMVGSASTSLSSMFSYPINISHPEVHIQLQDKKLELSKIVLGSPIIVVRFNLIIGTLINSEIIQVMNVESAKEQVDALLKMMSNLTAGMEVSHSTPEAFPVQSSASYQTPPIQAPPPPPVQQPVQQPVAAAPVSSAMNMPPPQYHQTASYNPPPQPPSHQQQVTVQPVQFTSFDNISNMYGEVNQNLNILMDVKLELTVELGRTILPIKNVLELTRGSIVELDKIAGEPVELYANGKLIAKGEVVVIEDNFGLRVTNIVSPENRVKDL